MIQIFNFRLVFILLIFQQFNIQFMPLNLIREVSKQFVASVVPDLQTLHPHCHKFLLPLSNLFHSFEIPLTIIFSLCPLDHSFPVISIGLQLPIRPHKLICKHFQCVFVHINVWKFFMQFDNLRMYHKLKKFVYFTGHLQIC